MKNRMPNGAFDPLLAAVTWPTLEHDVQLWYLATPFTDYPHGKAHAVLHAARVAAALIARGIPTFCPVAHSQVLYSAGMLPHGDEPRLTGPYTHITDGWQMWMDLCAPFMDAAGGLIVAQLPGWAQSKGVTVETRAFLEAGKPVIRLPLDLLRPVIEGGAGCGEEGA